MRSHPEWVCKEIANALDRDGIIQSRCHYAGEWYHQLEVFPAAYVDRYGYLPFRSRDEFERSADIVITKDVHAKGRAISRSPRYVQVVREPSNR